MIAASGDRTGIVRLWDLASDKTARQDHLGEVPKIALAAIGAVNLIAIGTDSGEVRISTVAEADEPWRICHRHKAAISAITLGSGPAGPLLATSDTAGTGRLFDVNGDRFLMGSVRLGAAVDVIGCGVLRSGEPYFAVAGPANGGIRLWRVGARSKVSLGADWNIHGPGFDTHSSSEVAGFGRGPDGEVLALTTLRLQLSEDRKFRNTLALWDVVTGKQVSEWSLGSEFGVIAAGFVPQPHGPSVAVVADQDNAIHAWDAGTETTLWEPVRCTGTARITAVDIGWTADQRPLLIVGDQDDTVRVIDPPSQRTLLDIRRRSTPTSVRMCADLICIRDDDGLAVLRTATADSPSS
jgi:WD40 repeat protein